MQGLAFFFGREMARLRKSSGSEMKAIMDWVLLIIPEEDTPQMRRQMVVETVHQMPQDAPLVP